MATHTPQRNILVVDDDARIVEEIARALRERPEFTVHTSTNGEDALSALQTHHYDLLITDWRLGEFDGLRLINEAQRLSEHTVTVLMSAFNMETAKQNNLTPLAHHYLEKPFALDDLVSVVESIFPASAQRTEGPARVLKVVLGGDANVGKTSLIQRYCNNTFDPQRKMTIGVDFHLFDTRVDHQMVRMVVWDLGGQERFCYARQAFYRGTQAVGLVFDASNRVSFYNLMRWWRETREYLPDVPVLMLANKIDLPRQVPTEEAQQIALAWDIPYFESSCATGEGVDDFFQALAEGAWQNVQINVTA